MPLSKWIMVLLACGLLGAAVFWLWWPSFAGTRGIATVERARGRPAEPPKYAAWDRFLRVVVDDQGRVDYTAALAARPSLDAFLEEAARAAPGDFRGDSQRLAFYLNAYNAMVIDGVLRRWPIASVEEAGPFHRFFRLREHTLAGVPVSLHGFESRIIRRYDPRLHFALNCASASCPPLRGEAYRAEILARQLDDQARAFINDPAFNRYQSDERTWRLSKIFEWYAADFGGEAGVRRLLRRFAAFSPHEDAVLRYVDYDWSLNESRVGG